MDNNPDQSTQPVPDDPVFSSTDLTQTKARRDSQYFTNVHKATPWQKLSNWFNKINRESLARSDARKAALKAKLEERRRATDLAAISTSINQQSPAPHTQAIPQPQPTPTSSPAPVTSAPAQSASAPQSTIIIESSAPRPKAQNNRSRIFLFVILIILIIGLVIALVIIRPWDNHAAIVSATGQVIELKGEPTGNLDMATSNNFEALSFQSQVLNSTTLDVYTDSQLADSTSRSPYIIADNIDQVLQINQITDPSNILFFNLEKARVFIIYGDYDSAWEILGSINEDDLYESQQKTFFAVMQFYYNNIGDPDKAAAYALKYDASPVYEMGE